MLVINCSILTIIIFLLESSCPVPLSQTEPCLSFWGSPNSCWESPRWVGIRSVPVPTTSTNMCVSAVDTPHLYSHMTRDTRCAHTGTQSFLKDAPDTCSKAELSDPDTSAHSHTADLGDIHPSSSGRKEQYQEEMPT